MAYNVTALEENRSLLAEASLREFLITKGVFTKTILQPTVEQALAGSYNIPLPSAGLETVAINSDGEYASATTASISSVTVEPTYFVGHKVQTSRPEFESKHTPQARAIFEADLGVRMGMSIVQEMERTHVINAVLAAVDSGNVEDATGGLSVNALLDAQGAIEEATLANGSLMKHAYFTQSKHIKAIESFRDYDKSGSNELLVRGDIANNYLGSRFGYETWYNVFSVTDAQIFDAISKFQNQGTTTTSIDINGVTYADTAALTAGFDAHALDPEDNPELAAFAALKAKTLGLLYTSRVQAHIDTFTPRVAQVDSDHPEKLQWNSAVAWGGRNVVEEEVVALLLPASVDA